MVSIKANVKIHTFSRKELNWMLLAARIALSSTCRQRVGAVVVKGGRILSMATNIDYNNPKNLEEPKIALHASLCAERRALATISGDIKGAIVYTARVSRKDGSLVVSKPCRRCIAVMNERGVKRAVCVSD